MLELPGYSCREILFQGTRFTTFRGVRARDGREVAVKVPILAPCPLELSASLKHELEMARRFDDPRVLAAVALETTVTGYALVTEDFGGVSLKQWLNGAALEPLPFLRLALQLIDCLACVHEAGVIHKDVKPSNYIVSPDTSTVKITDFGIAVALPRERGQLSSTAAIEGTLAYMSPEQSGRMNRSLDARSDLYSLGVTFYEILTGALPFVSPDPIELIHSHIARRPAPPAEVKPTVPATLSEIVMKLLAKTAEERYQSTFGLKADLQRCLTDLETTGQITAFRVGESDISERLQVPQRLYGREGVSGELTGAFQRTAGGAVEMLMVAGYSGIGKSALVGELGRPVAEQRGYFISGKFDQLRRDIPYSAVIQAFRELVLRILTESPERLAAWRARLEEALGADGQEIVGVIPEVELILGKPPRLPDVDPAEARVRFSNVFRSFVRTVAAPQHPLALFLDDLQWADAASLQLIRLLLTDPDLTHLLLVGAVRDNEIGPGHPLTLLLGQLREDGTSLTHVALEPLSCEHVTQLIADTLRVAPEQAGDLASVVWSKTRGNPFFVIEFLTAIHHERMLSFSSTLGRWEWSMERIRAADITENVVDLLMRRLERLDPVPRRMLEFAACVGSAFDLRSLSTVAELPPVEVASMLEAPLQEELIVPVGMGYKYSDRIRSDGEGRLEGAGAIAYRFRHDRIRLAAYQLIPALERPALHQRIGRLMLSQSAQHDDEEHLFEIVSHLNVAAESLTGEAERIELSALNLRAARKARASTAYGPAMALLSVGIGLLPPTSWRTHYALTYDLHLLRAELIYLSTEFTGMEQATSEVLRHTRDVLDEVRVYELQIQYHQHRREYPEAVKTALLALRKLGDPLADKPTKLHAVAALGVTQVLMRGKGADDLDSLPEMTDPRCLAQMRVLVKVTSSAYFGAPDLFPLVVFRMVQLTIRHGVTGLSAYGYVTYGLALITILGQYEQGYRFGRLALRTLDRFGAEDMRSKILHVFGLWVRHYKEDFDDCAAASLEGVESGLATGDIEYASYCSSVYCIYTLTMGEPLPVVIERMVRMRAAAVRHKHSQTYTTIGTEGVALERLIGATAEPTRFGPLEGTSALDEVHALEKASSTAFDHSYRCMVHYLLGEYEECLASAAVVEQHAPIVAGMAYVPLYTFYQSLAHLALYPRLGPLERARALLVVANNQRKARKWALHSPRNYAHAHDLVEAERARVGGEHPSALRSFERAVASSSEAGYIHDIALCQERAARYYLELGLPSSARTYQEAALHGYHRWGARAVVERLQREWPGVRIEATGPAASETTGSFSSTRLDLEAVLRAARAISTEILLTNLLERLISLALESGGAERGILLLQEEGQLVLAAESSASGEVTLLEMEPLLGSDRLSTAIVQYAARTGRDVVLDDALESERFRADPHVQSRRLRSVLCTPLAHQGKLSGLLYLENNLAGGAFAHERVEMVRLLAGQAAIAIENARLYATLDARVKTRTRELRESNDALAGTVQRLRETQAQLVTQGKLASLGALTAGIAHEIENPLNFVINFSELSVGLADELREGMEGQRGRIEPEVAEDLEALVGDLQENARTIAGHGRRADNIVRAMLAHAREGGGERREVDLNQLLSDYLERSSPGQGPASPGVKAEIERRFDPSVKPLWVNPQEIGRVFLSLLDNARYAVAAKHRSGGAGFHPLIRITTRDLDDRVEVRVWDNGVGVPPAIREQIFTPFFTTKPSGEGAGLGLSISHEIVVQGNGGTLKVESEEGSFTEFTFTLPVGRDSVAPA